MSTLIISAAASALGSYLAPGVIAFGITGGQLGYFAGSFLGNALFSASPPDIEGPRLSELKVQVSTYGNMLPLTYGTVRQAGNIIWSTDLIEDKNSESAGGKGGGGQEVTTYTYRVNFAVALCEGPIDSILRLWANGTLIFDKSTTLNSGNFRFYNGDESQLPDALIEAYLGVGNVPGYRGVAYVVFENMQLADYGNRIPNLTFEVLKKAASMPPIIQLNLNGYKIVDGWPSTQSMIAVKANGTGNPTQIALINPMTQVITEINSSIIDISGGNTTLSTVYIENYFCPELLQNIFINQVWAVGYGFLPNSGQVRVFDAESGVAVLSSIPSNPDFITKMTYLAQYQRVVIQTGSAISSQYNKLYFFKPINYLLYTIGSSVPLLDFVMDIKLTTAPNAYQPTQALYDALGYIVMYSQVVNVANTFCCQIFKLDLNKNAFGTHDISGFSLAFSATNITGRTSSDGLALIDIGRNCVVIFTMHSNANSNLVVTKIDLTSYVVTEKVIVTAETFEIDAMCFHNILSDRYILTGTNVNHTIIAVNASDLTLDLFSASGSSVSIAPSGVETPRYTNQPINLNNGYYLANIENNFSYLIPSFPLGGNILAEIVKDICQRVSLNATDIDVTNLLDTVDGYTISAINTARSSIEGLQAAYYFDAVESNSKIKFVKRGGLSALKISTDDMACHEYGQEQPSNVEMTRTQEFDLPREINVTYLDKSFDYQQNTQKSQRMTGNGLSVLNLPLAIVMNKDKAKQVADANLFNLWAERTQFNLVISRKYAYLEPTDIIDFFYANNLVSARIVQKDEGSPGLLKLKLAFEDASVYTQMANAGSSNALFQSQTVAEKLATIGLFFDIPLLRDEDNNAGFYYAQRGFIKGELNSSILFKSSDGGQSYTQVQAFFSTPGNGRTSLLGPFKSGNIFDEINSITVVLNNGTLASATELAILNFTANVCVIGDEILQYKTAILIAPNTYRLSSLLRGRRGTEYAINSHVEGERFTLVEPASFCRVAMDNSQIGMDKYYKSVTIGSTLSSTAAKIFKNSAKGLLCYSPVEIGGGLAANGDIAIFWKRRSRLSGAWVDNIDTPLGEVSELYDCDIYNQGETAIVKTINNIATQNTIYLASENSAAANPLPVKIFQKSAIAGRGFAGQGLIFTNKTPNYRAASQWRLLFSANNGGVNLEIARLEFLDAYYANNIALNGVASASAGTAANAFDADVATVWTTLNTGADFISYTFSAPVIIVQYKVTGSAISNRCPSAWKLEYFDGFGWVTLQTILGQANWLPNQQRVFSL